MKIYPAIDEQAMKIIAATMLAVGILSGASGCAMTEVLETSPKRATQGFANSCTVWALSYSVEAETGRRIDKDARNAAWLVTQRDGRYGAKISDALEAMKSVGLVPDTAYLALFATLDDAPVVALHGGHAVAVLSVADGRAIVRDGYYERALSVPVSNFWNAKFFKVRGL